MFIINCLGKKTADRQFPSIKRKKQNVQKTKGTRSGIFVDVLIFLLAISNIKNHPKIAKFIFLIPWIQVCFNFIEEWLK